MTEFLRDSFTDVDGTNLTAHTGETGATWTKHPANVGDIKITGNTARGDGTNLTYYTASGTPATADYTLDIDVPVGSLIGNDLFYLWGRRDTVADTGYFCRVYRPGTNAHALGKGVAGTYTVLATYSADVAAATTYHWLFTLTGTSLEFKIDGVSRATATDSSITAKGKAGITERYSTAAAAGIYCDLIVGTDAGGTTKAITPAAINATSSMTAAIQRPRPIPGAAVNATSAMTASVQRLRPLPVAAITSTSTVTGSLTFLRAVKPAAITATSPVTATVTGGTGATPAPLRSLVGYGL